jgi:hypothetical protein
MCFSEELKNQLTKKTNEIARLREEANNWHQHYRDERRKAKSWKEWGFKQQDEVTRFRDALELIANATGGDDARYYQDIAQTALSEVALITAQNDPPTEEPVSLDPAPKFTHEGNLDENIKQPEWRELLPEEEIHTGDQVQAKHHDKIHGVWLDVFPYEIGAMPIDHEAFRYRTRRPLPKQEEMPLVMVNPENFWKWMELQEEINRDIAGEIQAIRDEIQKLKEAR